MGNEWHLQERLSALSAYSYGTEGGVENGTPNPWGLRLGLLRAFLVLGLFVSGVSGGVWSLGWFSPFLGMLGVLSGGLVCLAAAWGVGDWLAWRSIPQDVLERRIREPLLNVAVSLSDPLVLPLFIGAQTRTCAGQFVAWRRWTWFPTSRG